MDHSRPYTIQFIYEIAEEAAKFPLQANVTIMPDRTYFVNNIQLAGKTDGSLIPPIRLTNQDGSWVYTDSKKETALSLAVGHAIQRYEESMRPN